MDEADDDTPIDLPIDGILDLHTFRPRDVKELVPDYLAECRERGTLDVRIIHGKGIGALRRTVHAILSRLPEVASLGWRWKMQVAGAPPSSRCERQPKIEDSTHEGRVSRHR